VSAYVLELSNGDIYIGPTNDVTAGSHQMMAVPLLRRTSTCPQSFVPMSPSQTTSGAAGSHEALRNHLSHHCSTIPSPPAIAIGQAPPHMLAVAMGSQGFKN
jgi:hypothetical protein